MRPNILSNATKVLIVLVALTLSFADFAQARDRSSESHFGRRPHFERQHRERSEFRSGVRLGSHHWRRAGRGRFSDRTVHRRHFERRYGHHRRHDRRVVREYRGRDRSYRMPNYGGDGFPSETLGGTYFGGLSAWTDPGNGTYFRSERYGYDYYGGETNEDYYAPRAKIIRVNPSTAGRACSWEAGVCVIRR